MNTSSSLPRPYIGSCRNRNYISNKPSLLSNDYYFSTIRSSKSFLPNQLKKRIYLSNGLFTNILQERVPIIYGSSPIPLDERQLNQEQKAKTFLSSSSLFLFPTITPRTYYDQSSFLIKEQQKFSNSYQDESKQIPNNSSSSSTFLNDNNYQSHHLTTITPIHPLTSNVCQLDNNMSSLRYSYDQRISDQGNKYIIQLKTDDYQENEFIITPRYYQNQLIIDAKHNEEDSFGGFIRRELHKIFLIPKHIDLNKYTYSYNKNTQELTIEMPYLQSNTNETKSDSSKNINQSLTFSYNDLNLTNGANILPTIHSTSNNNTSGFSKTTNDSILTIGTSTNEPLITNTKPFDFDLFHRSAFRPQIIPTPTNENKLLMSLDLSDYQPEDIKIIIKDQELIVKAERKIQTDTKKSRTSFFQSTSLPPQTDVEHLRSNYIDGKLIIEAPYTNRKNKTNEQTVIEFEEKTISNDPYQQRTQTVTEFVRLRRY